MRVATNLIKVLDGQNRDHSDKSIIESIGKEGVLVPLLVYKDEADPDGFILVAGHRRLASAIHFGLPEVPVEIIMKEQAEKARALENLDRKGLHPLDEAMEIRTLQAEGYDNSVICAMLGMSQGKLIRRSKLNNLSKTVKNAFLEGKIDAAAAEEYSVMPEKAQDTVYQKFAGNYIPSANTIRAQYLGMQGVSLSRCSKLLMNSEPSCKGCPNNIASDNVLFEDADGTCKDTECYCRKLRALAEKEKARIYEDNYDKDERITNLLKKDGIKVAKILSYYVSSSKSGNQTDKVISIRGQIGYAEAQEPKKKENTTAEKRKKEITKQYKELYDQLLPALGKMLYEHADAWVQKFHKDERFPDKDERVILAKALYWECVWDLDEFIHGKRYFSKQAPLEGADNKRIFSVMFLYASVEHKNEEVWPHKPEDGTKLNLPKSMDLEDLFQLKTSKAKKKVLELKASMEALLKEYSELK